MYDRPVYSTSMEDEYSKIRPNGTVYSKQKDLVMDASDSGPSLIQLDHIIPTICKNFYSSFL